MSSTEISQRLQPLIHLLQNSVNNDYIGEPVSQYEHAIQAAHFARVYMKLEQETDSNNNNPTPLTPSSKELKITDSSISWSDDEVEVILAALLHDVGHSIAMDPPSGFEPYPQESEQSLIPESRFMDKFGAFSHESIGARYLSTLGFSASLCAMVAAHVAVKRYLCAVEPSYHERLSPASRSTLKYQGGPMTKEEVAQFEADPLKRKKIIIRYCDELAKQESLQVDNLVYYIPMLVAHIHNLESSKLNGKSLVEEESKESLSEKSMS